MNIKQKIISFCPSKIYVLLKGSGWFGDFQNWKVAENKCKGYNNDIIFQKVTESISKVKNGEAVFERDSVLFSKPEYNFPILSTLLWINSISKNELHVLDFGGSLGSSYFQNKFFLDSIPLLKWNIVEQDKFVEIGKRRFQNEILQFYYSIDECIKDSKCNCVILSSVLPYIENPYEVLNQILLQRIEFVFVDKTSFTTNNTNRITIQKVPNEIYEASYPCWFFSENQFVDFFLKNGYRLVFDFQNPDFANISSIFKGFLFQKISL